MQGRTRAAGMTGQRATIGCLVMMIAAGGCVGPGRMLTPRERTVAAAARPILTLDANANWTECYNLLLDLAPTSVSYLASRPVMRRPVPPGDLSTAVHLSLLRLLANPATAPRLSLNTLETTGDVLHLDPNVRGRRLGPVYLAPGPQPQSLFALYPSDFDHAVAARIDLEADRQALRRWWLEHAGQPSTLASSRRLEPRPDSLWRLLGRRRADRWTYAPEPAATLCADTGRGSSLLWLEARDYNLVRAACVLLGSSGDEQTRERLIELVGHPFAVVAHNARFALRFAADPRIRALIERFERDHEEQAPSRPEARRHLFPL